MHLFFAVLVHSNDANGMPLFELFEMPCDWITPNSNIRFVNVLLLFWSILGAFCIYFLFLRKIPIFAPIFNGLLCCCYLHIFFFCAQSSSATQKFAIMHKHFVYSSKIALLFWMISTKLVHSVSYLTLVWKKHVNDPKISELNLICSALDRYSEQKSINMMQISVLEKLLCKNASISMNVFYSQLKTFNWVANKVEWSLY